MNKSKILISLLFVWKIRNCLSANVKSLTDLDSELEDAIEYVTPEFAKSLKRRFTNAGVSEEFRGYMPALPAIKFTDIFIRDGGNQITLKNLIIQKHPIARLNEIIPNLYEKNVRISTDWYNLKLIGSYEMTNSSQIKLLPVRNIGNIEINVENIAAIGLVGFKIDHGALKTTNFDLKFKSENVKIDVEYVDSENNNSTKSSQVRKNIDDSIVKYLKRDLFWKLKETLRHRLDHVLQDFQLTEIFEENDEISQKYVAQSDIMDKFFNKIIDQFLKDIKKKIIVNGYDNIAAPDFATDFAHRFGLVTFWGSFQAVNGTIQDLSTLKRTNKFSISKIPNSRDVMLFGSIGFDELLINYNSYYAQIWNVGPRGGMKAAVGDNSIKLSLIVEIRDWLEFDINIKNLDVQVEQFDNVKIDATGMSVLLDWLLSYTITWMTGVFKTEIITMIEDNLKEMLETFLPKLSTTFKKNSF